MTRKNWCITLSALLALGGAAQADDGPCKAPRACNAASVSQEVNSASEQTIEQRLLRKVSVNFKDVPLSQIVDDLRALGRINVVLDREALQGAGIDLNLPLSLKVEDMSLKSVLHVLLLDAQMTFVIKDEALQITTREAARGKLRVVTYPVADLVTPIGDGDAELAPFLCRACPDLTGKRKPRATAEDVLIRLITQTIDWTSWYEVGGRGTIQYFPRGLALVVSQTADVQEQIANLLIALRRTQALEDRQEQVEARVITKTPSGDVSVQLPKLTFFRGQQAHIEVCDYVALRTGTIRDWLRTDAADDEAQEDGAAKRPTLAKNGMRLALLVTKAAQGKLKLDATFEQSKITEATTTGMQISGQTCRAIQHVESGGSVKMVLSKDARGEPRRWVVITLTELPVEEECEQIYQGALPPIPR